MRRNLLFVLAVILGGALASNSSALALARSRKICTTNPPAGIARCHAIVLTDGGGVIPLVSSTPQGYSPAAFRTVYGVHNASSTDVGVVVAYDDPTIQNDVTTFSKAFGLPALPSCTAAAQLGCLAKFNQRGTSSYPAINSSWSVETSLDVESVHGMCPGCRISLVEASTASQDNLSAAVDQAVAQGAKVVSNSYGSAETPAEAAYDSHYRRAGVTFVASSGDSGYGVNYPAAATSVVAVGGTSLQVSGGRFISEVAWDGAGSGCSHYETKPTWQHDKTCASRSVADVAADADPATGAAIYDSSISGGRSGWLTVGGTSLAAPLVAGMLASSAHVNNEPNYLYTNSASDIRDIVSGKNGSCASYLCKAGAGYDGPTGIGVLSRL